MLGASALFRVGGQRLGVKSSFLRFGTLANTGVWPVWHLPAANSWMADGQEKNEAFEVDHQKLLQQINDKYIKSLLKIRFCLCSLKPSPIL